MKDAWADTTSAHGRLMLTVLGGLAEFERELIRARTGEGRKRAQERGVRFGRPRKFDAPSEARGYRAATGRRDAGRYRPILCGGCHDDRAAGIGRKLKAAPADAVRDLHELIGVCSFEQSNGRGSGNPLHGPSFPPSALPALQPDDDVYPRGGAGRVAPRTVLFPVPALRTCRDTRGGQPSASISAAKPTWTQVTGLRGAGDAVWAPLSHGGAF